MRRFKFIFMSLVMAICLLGSSTPSSASSYSTGKAVIPSYSQGSTIYTRYLVSNITDYPINVTVTFYNTDGTLVTDDNNISTGRISGSDLLNYNDQITDSTVTFTLNAHSSGKLFTSNTADSYYGYGVIEWKQGGSALQGLVVTGTYIITYNNQDIRNSIPVNNGLPF